MDSTIALTESSYVWEELISRLKERGANTFSYLRQIACLEWPMQFIMFSPKAVHQVCCVHVSRNIASKVRVKDRAMILNDFKGVYQASDYDKAIEALRAFRDKRKKKYPRVVAVITNNQLLTFYKFPETIRRSIYSMNLIEAFNKEIKQYVKRKEQFPNELPWNIFCNALSRLQSTI